MGRKMKRIEVREIIVDRIDFDGFSLEAAINELLELKRKYSEEYHELSLDLDL